MTEIEHILAAVADLMAPKEVGVWLKESNEPFEGATPLQVIERGEQGRILRMIERLEAGEPM